MESLVNKITDGVNTFNFDQELFNKLMSKEHRTLQQSFTRMCISWLEFIATEEYKKITDDRNIQSHNTAKLIINSFENYLISTGIKPEQLEFYKPSKALGCV